MNRKMTGYWLLMHRSMAIPRRQREKMKEILEAKGAKKVAITDLSRDDMAEAIEDAFRYDKLVLASSFL